MNNVFLKWKYPSDELTLNFIFHGKLSKELAAHAIQDWDKAFRERPFGSVDLVWNCLKMTSYQPTAAKIWKEALNKHENRIENIWVVSNNPLIRLGARTMTMISNFNLKAVSCEEEIMIKELNAA